MKKEMKNKKAGLEFGWIFAVIVGAVILFLAFYFVGTHMIGERMQRETVEAQAFETIMNPLSFLGSLGATTKQPLTLTQKAELLISCENASETQLGYNAIEVITKKREGERIPRKAYDKYIFADLEGVEVKKLDSFTISFDMPWRVADLTMIWPADRQYCFINDTIKIQELQEKLEDLEIPSINFTTTPDDSCDITVCEKGSGVGTCNIMIDPKASIANNLPYAGDALLLAAVFSEPHLYECNLMRLGKRLSMQTAIYQEKALASCNIGSGSALTTLNNSAINISQGKFGQLRTLKSAADSIASANRHCGLY